MHTAVKEIHKPVPTTDRHFINVALNLARRPTLIKRIPSREREFIYRVSEMSQD